jgi:ubiquinone/menaquinone biosynthesis C-methylase UbiE
MTKKRDTIVEGGYNRIAQSYQDQRNRFHNREDLERLLVLLPKNPKVLDAGCGAGVPVAKFLTERGCRVIGVDLSQKMIELARKNVPGAEFIKREMTELEFEENSFDGLTAFYSVIHVPREKHAELLQNFHRILKPGGVMLISMGAGEWEGIEEFHGVEMFWSHYGPERSLELIKQAGFEILFDKLEKRGGEEHYWILAINGG